ncbi:MAG: 30S ribosomal protein S4 [Candidatus Thermoplasmatota archaeon]|nr:30S ribosomal protein S4 [Candidatus Thermoplasmatota archaeon]
MGDPKFPSKHYNTPSHPWQKTRIEQERTLTHQYGLKSKKEIWKADTKVREMRRQARKLTAKANDQQAQKEKELLLGKLNRLGMLEQGAALEDILRMSPENILDRRLQTQVYLQGLASTVKQSRQLIIHGHISVEGAVNRVPGMLVTKNQEKNITYSPSSALNSDLHPVRPGAKATYEDEEIIEAENEEVPHEEPKAETGEEKNVSEDEEKEAN